LSTPPFCVVHANRAFCIFSGLSSGDIIGKPVESLLRVVVDQDTRVLSLTVSGTLSSNFIFSKKPCQLHVIPVTEKFRNPRGGMSHLLVKVQARDEAEAGVGNGIIAGSLVSKNLSVHGHHQVLGAIG
jgi:PAS domain-containing protein